MKIEKLPSGSYRVRKTINGKTHSLVFDHKPGKFEIEEKLHSLYFINDNNEKIARMTFQKAAEEVIDSKKNILSPASVREYERKITRIPWWFVEMDIDKITDRDIQKVINQYSENHAPKTVRDIYAFITSVLAYFGAKPNKPINLPQKIKHDVYLPTEEEIKVILDEAKETMFEIPIRLALCGLRRSEILCVTAADIVGGELRINRAMVENRDNEWVVKTTKTYESTRTIPIPEDLCNMIKEQGYAYNGGAQSISNFMKRTQKKLGMNEFSLHSLRHYFASKMFSLGYSIREIEYLGGWEKNSQVLQEIYAQRMLTATKEGRENIMKNYFNSIG